MREDKAADGSIYSVYVWARIICIIIFPPHDFVNFRKVLKRYQHMDLKVLETTVTVQMFFTE